MGSLDSVGMGGWVGNARCFRLVPYKLQCTALKWYTFQTKSDLFHRVPPSFFILQSRLL